MFYIYLKLTNGEYLYLKYTSLISLFERISQRDWELFRVTSPNCPPGHDEAAFILQESEL